MILEKQPKSMIIIGAGAIGVEFAYFYNAFGTKVTMVEMLPNVLPVEDTEIERQHHEYQREESEPQPGHRGGRGTLACIQVGVMWAVARVRRGRTG